MVLLTDKLGFP